mmetsp:Transcript_18919/g.48390  ORF Transcript_18919/g.48390 Transcript_18919/m.48390 type:complete len:203 (-) Transcript_18919:258-866(-)
MQLPTEPRHVDGAQLLHRWLHPRPQFVLPPRAQVPPPCRRAACKWHWLQEDEPRLARATGEEPRHFPQKVRLRLLRGLSHVLHRRRGGFRCQQWRRVHVRLLHVCQARPPLVGFTQLVCGLGGNASSSAVGKGRRALKGLLGVEHSVFSYEVLLEFCTCVRQCVASGPGVGGRLPCRLHSAQAHRAPPGTPCVVRRRQRETQ